MFILHQQLPINVKYIFSLNFTDPLIPYDVPLFKNCRHELFLNLVLFKNQTIENVKFFIIPKIYQSSKILPI